MITGEASLRKINLDFSSKINDASAFRVLELLHPKIDELYALVRQIQLIEALKEISLQEADTSFMSEEYKEILKNADEIKKSYELQPRKLGYLWGIITDL